MKKLVLAIAALVLAAGCLVFLAVTIAQPKVPINIKSAQGVYDMTEKSFDGVISGWSTSKGFGSVFDEIKATASTTHTLMIAGSAIGAAILLIVGLRLLGGARKEQKLAAESAATGKDLP